MYFARHCSASDAPRAMVMQEGSYAMRLPFILAVLLVATPVGATHLPQTKPDPSLSPQDVVSIQIEALQRHSQRKIA